MKKVIVVKKTGKAQTTAEKPRVVRKLTPRQQKAIDLLMVGDGRNKADILREGGYSDSVIDQPGKVFDSPAVREVINPWLERLKNMREAILKQMESKVGRASFKDLPKSFQVISTQIALIEGTPTANIAVLLKDAEKERIDKILF